jgi:hypothetical protein
LSNLEGEKQQLELKSRLKNAAAGGKITTPGGADSELFALLQQ